MLLSVLALPVAATPALAAVPDAVLAPPMTGGGLLGGIAHAVLGGVDWTVNVAGDFILNLLGGLVRDLIPRSWIRESLQIMGWLVALPDYSSRVPGPGGGRRYGFAGVNAMRELYMWLGMAIAPLTLVYATSRSCSGQGDPPHVPLSRVLIVGVALLSYTWLWSQAVALTNLITHAILGVGAVISGVQKMFEVLIAGVALRGLPLIGLVLMGIGGLQLIALIFVKVALILIGALVFATGPLMIGLVATDRGNAFGRAWLTIATGLFVLPLLWASVFAIAAVLINDASRGASVIGGDSSIGQILGGLLIALAAIAGFWLNIKLTRGFAGLVGGQLAGLLALAGSGARALLSGASRGASSAAGAGASSAGSGAASLRAFASKVGGAVAGAGGALMPAGRAGAVLAGAGTLARGGLVGAGSALASRGVAGVASSGVARAAATSRAGAVATRAARGARSGWKAATRTATDTPTPNRTPTPPPATPPAPPADTPPTPAAPLAAPSVPVNADSSQGRPGRRLRKPTRSAPRRAAGAATTAPPAGGASRDRASSGTPSAGDAGNDAARAAFGQPQPSKPTRSLKRPFRGHRKP
jgi:hypothetical protein